MKLIKYILLFISISVFGANHYVSNTGGVDTLLISEISAEISGWSDGDSLLFKAGQVFNPSSPILISKSLKISRYGSGDNPIISGLLTLSKSLYSGNVYSGTASISGLNMVVVDENNAEIGRYPNDTYLDIDSHSGQTEITSSQLSGLTINPGNEVVVRTRHYILDREVISNFSGSTVTFSPTSVTFLDDKGFFLQNGLQYLDRNSEWYCDGSDLYVYLDNAVSIVKYASIDTVVYVTSDNVSIENIVIEGGNIYNIAVESVEGFILNNCTVRYGGNYGMYLHGYSADINCTVKNNTFDELNNFGIWLKNEATSTNVNWNIHNNIINNVAMFQGMGGSGNAQHIGLKVYGRGINVYNNSLDSIGYIGISVGGFAYGDYINIYQNYIRNTCLIKQDGAAIYANYGTDGSTADTSVYFNNINIHNNIVNGVGGYRETEGTDGKTYAEGLYNDTHINGINWYNNTIMSARHRGFVAKNLRNEYIHNNTIWDCGTGIFLTSEDGLAWGTAISNNIVYGDDSLMYGDNTNYWQDYQIDSNTYITPISFVNAFSTDNYSNKYSFAGWNGLGFDLNGDSIIAEPELRLNTSVIDTITLSVDSTYTLANGTTQTGGTILPMSSEMFISIVRPQINSILGGYYGGYINAGYYGGSIIGTKQ